MTESQQHKCDDCQKLFSRYEHLVRHINSAHRNERPHVCSFCSRSFARSDVLTRHITLHTRPATAMTKDRRHRIHRACTNCKSSKLKCDGLKPTCTRCNQRGKQCSFMAEMPKPEPFTPASPPPTKKLRLPSISSWAPDLF
ncbi:hypothetical protein WALSEDRAFT_67290 [Wallemia mellicola CBS 633.66]|uniref:Zn(2)-C6 fungal-type domain-containing protein n=1 Tax=Wallemia mellicola (strain ATCC MYA-4683 / CBS 633.66) TaxID=671144 RepID=I4YI69_WALMC|nr:hypothetical protein WALSEDRAFT_67290 [Wallemia mellicola CBS 633.66]EIM23661.1 hypothetical protein WALSEDRAFT_67290 [Wallemia mellicola CBS 633.66]|eukprot:XP_006956328.1 hypothetical protein WALSEDRAFT_67290 [Wallemia mellicola CBS 633.66]